MKPRARLDVTSCPNRELNGTKPSVPNEVMFNFILLEVRMSADDNDDDDNNNSNNNNNSM